MPPSFQAFSLHGTGRLNKLITEVEVSVAYDPASPPTPIPVMQKFRALWDTGATHVNISPAVVTKLSLVPSGATRVNHAGGSGETKNTYVVNLGLPNHVGVAGVNVIEFHGNPEFEVLIGMDVIGMGDFALTHEGGKTCMSFRIPSQKRIDYVIEADRINFRGVTRNQPCPCNSGKKFKLCHGVNL